MQSDLTALIERVESGAGSDRGLDHAICCAVLDATKHKGWWNFQAMRPRGEPERPASEFWKRFGPAYTSSLDAVLSLIEAKLPGWAFVVHGPDAGGTHYGGVGPSLNEAWASDRPDSRAPSPARALLAAALRAIQESRNDR